MIAVDLLLDDLVWVSDEGLAVQHHRLVCLLHAYS